MNVMCGICSCRWDTVGNGSSALMEYHEELVWRLSTLIEYREELGEVGTLVELWGVFILVECHDVFGGQNVQHLLVCGQ